MKIQKLIVVLTGLIILLGTSCQKGEQNLASIHNPIFKDQVKYLLLNVQQNEWCDKAGPNCLPWVTIKPNNQDYVDLLRIVDEPDEVALFFASENYAIWSALFPDLEGTDFLEKLQSGDYTIEVLNVPSTPGNIIMRVHNSDESDYFGLTVIEES